MLDFVEPKRAIIHGTTFGDNSRGMEMKGLIVIPAKCSVLVTPGPHELYLRGAWTQRGVKYIGLAGIPMANDNRFSLTVAEDGDMPIALIRPSTIILEDQRVFLDLTSYGPIRVYRARAFKVGIPFDFEALWNSTPSLQRTAQ